MSILWKLKFGLVFITPAILTLCTSSRLMEEHLIIWWLISGTASNHGEEDYWSFWNLFLSHPFLTHWNECLDDLVILPFSTNELSNKRQSAKSHMHFQLARVHMSPVTFHDVVADVLQFWNFSKSGCITLTPQFSTLEFRPNPFIFATTIWN